MGTTSKVKGKKKYQISCTIYDIEFCEIHKYKNVIYARDFDEAYKMAEHLYDDYNEDFEERAEISVRELSDD